MKIGYFAWHNRKLSAYSARNKLHSEYNGKISAYFSSVVDQGLAFMLVELFFHVLHPKEGD
jgi:hypothetical protein